MKMFYMIIMLDKNHYTKNIYTKLYPVADISAWTDEWTYQHCHSLSHAMAKKIYANIFEILDIWSDTSNNCKKGSVELWFDSDFFFSIYHFFIDYAINISRGKCVWLLPAAAPPVAPNLQIPKCILVILLHILTKICADKSFLNIIILNSICTLQHWGGFQAEIAISGICFF